MGRLIETYMGPLKWNEEVTMPRFHIFSDTGAEELCRSSLEKIREYVPPSGEQVENVYLVMKDVLDETH